MQRDLGALAANTYDLVVIGGGIFGACAAWDATLRGLSVALIEKGDFCGGVSANSFKVVHGGIRYLQHGDLVRLRSSCAERSALLRIAPHLVQPLPIAIPTYGYGKLGKWFLGAGMLLYDLLTLDRNRGIRDPARRVRWTQFWSRAHTLSAFPGLPEKGLTGAAVFCDGQMYNPTRLVLAFLKSAVARGACVANHLEAVGFDMQDGEVQGVRVRDRISNVEFPVLGRAVLNASGPWGEDLVNRALKRAAINRGPYSRDACFVVPRRFPCPHALAVQGRTHDPGALLARPARHLFAVPWRDYTLIGVWHKVVTTDPDRVSVGADELQSYIDEVNWAYPEIKLSLRDVRMWNAGLVPFGENEPGSEHLRYGKRSRLVDHAGSGGPRNLVTLIGIRYTMGRGDAAIAVDTICRKLGKRCKRPPTHRFPLYGGDVSSFARLVEEVRAAGVPAEAATSVAHNHGAAFPEMLAHADRRRGGMHLLPDSSVLEVEVMHAIRDEMALTLPDIVFRRTDLATGGHPGEAALVRCATIAAHELNWPEQRTRAELAEVRARFPDFAYPQGRNAPKENKN